MPSRTDSARAVPAVGQRSRTAVDHEHVGKPGLRSVSIRFDEETFDQIRARAVAECVSFAEAVRRLVEYSLEEFPGTRSGL